MANMFDWLMLQNIAQAQQAPMTPVEESPPLAPQMSMMPESQKQAMKQKMEEEKLKAQFPTFARNMQPQSMSFSLPTRDPQAEALAAQLREQYGKKIGQVDVEQDLLRKYIEGIGKLPTKLDFTPTAALADKWTGGGNQLTSAAQGMSGLSQEEKAKLLATLQDKVIGNEQALLNSIGQRLNLADSNKAQLRMAEMMDKNARFGMSQDLKKEDNLRNDIGKSVMMPVIDDQQNISIIEDAFSSGDSQMIGNVLSKYARSISGEKGVLTDGDITRVMPRNYQGTAASFMAYLSSTPSSELPKEYTDSMRKLIDVTKQRLADRYRTTLESKKKIYSSGAYAPLMGEGGVGKSIFGEAEAAINTFRPKTPQNTDGLNVDQSALEAEMKKRGL